MADAQPSESARAAEDVFATFLARQATDDPPSFEELVREHPQHEGELRRLNDDWDRVEGLLQRLGVTQTLSERIQSFHGQVDPGITLAPEESSPTVSRASSARLERLALLSAPESRYTVHSEIGRGGMGAIQRVWDEDLRRPIAMKIALGRREFLGAAERVELEPHKVVRFLEEAQITSQLEHPGIVPVHELGLDGHGRIYFTMRLVRGRNLRQIVEYVHHPELADEDGVRERWTLPGALAVLLRVTEAVAYAHSKGVIHRDLKPANVMVGRFGETYVMDWGLARVQGRKDLKNLRLREDESESQSEVRTDRLDEESQSADAPLVTMDGDVVGTPAYMSPEQARGRIDEVDEQSDVYGVGAMLYHLVTGYRPYMTPGERATAHTVLNAVRMGPPKPIEELAPRTSPELVAICERAMARKKAERYPSMEAFASDLRAFLEMRVVRAYRTGAVAEFKKWVARNKPLAASLAAVLLVTIAGLAAIGIQQARHVAELQPHVDGRELEIVRKMSDELWPAWPENADEIAYWLDRARALAAKRDGYAAALDELRQRALPPTELEAARERAAKEALRRELEVETFKLVRLRGEAERRGASWEPTPAYRDNVAAVEARIPELEAAVERRTRWSFADADDEVAHTLLADLVLGLGDVQATIQSLEERLAMARRLRTTDAADPAWEAFRADVRADPDFDGLDLEPIVGLEPLRRNDSTGRWELVWLPSGEPPEIATDGRLVMTRASGIVLVLVPGGETRIGCWAPGPGADGTLRSVGDPYVDVNCNRLKNGEGPVRTVRLDPFFVSKYEVTQGQWQRIFGHNPSYNYAGFIFDEVGEDATWIHPVDSVDWWSALEFTRRVGLRLATSTQWEYACRAGTTNSYVAGDDPTALADHANVIDLSYARLWGGHPELQMFPLDDGHVNTAPVGSLAPNAFGLYDMLGNVIEWCLDWHSPEMDVTIRDGDGWRQHREDLEAPVIRGGAWNLPASKARPAAYFGTEPENNQPSNGLRVVLPVPDGHSD